jgi:hypothetical protein
MIHVVVVNLLLGLPLLMHIELYEGVGVLKIKESELELLCTDSTALILSPTETSHTKFCGYAHAYCILHTLIFMYICIQLLINYAIMTGGSME